MTGKKKAKISPITAAEALEWDDVLADSTTAVSDVIQDILWSGAKMLVAHDVEKKSIDRSAYDAVHYAQEAVEAVLMKHDYGEVTWLPGPEGGDIPQSAWKEPPDTSVQGRLAMEQSWTLEEEPTCITIDRFGTGMVRSKTRVNKLTLDNVALLIPDAEAGGSSTSRSSASQKSSMSGTKRATKKRKPKKEAEPQRITRKLGKQAIQREATRLIELKKLEKKKKQRQRFQAQEQVLREEKKRYDKIQKDLRGKNYVLDETGKVVLVVEPKPERMPTMTLEPEVVLYDPVAIQEQLDAMERSKSKKVKKNAGSKQAKKVKKTVTMEALDRSKFIDVVTAMGPPVISVFEAQTGVCFSQGLQTNKGPSKEREGFDTMTRSEYNSHLKTQQGKAVVMRSPSPMKEAATDGELEGAVNLADGLTPAATLAPLAATLAPLAATLKRKLSPKSAAAASTAKAPPEDIFNQSILNDPTWGTKHKILPAGHRVGSSNNPLSPEQRAALRAQTAKEGRRGPRERPHAENKPTADRKFLPAPMYPANSGHGFDSSYGVTLPDINQSSRSSSSPGSLRTSNKGEVNKIIFASESAKMQLF